MAASRVVATLVLAGLLAGCTSPQDASAALVSRIGASTLVADGARLRDLATSESPSAVPESSWPESIRALRPRSVRVVPEGVFVQLSKRFVEEEGVFIAFAGVDVDTAPGHDPSFRALAPLVYWYEIKG